MLRFISKSCKSPLVSVIYPQIPARSYSQSLVHEPVDLQYDLFEPPNHANVSKGPLLILHGLLGSKRNWQSLSKAFARDLGRPVYTLDLRNHGSSPHARPMTYSAMASDVFHFCQKHSLENINVIGHSMGGKTAMTMALTPGLLQNRLSRVVVVDMAPNRGPLLPEFRNYLKAMSKIESNNITSRKQAHEILKECEPDEGIRSFILSNLVPPQKEGDGMRFRNPLDILTDSIFELGDFPYELLQQSWHGPVLMIKGSKSNYIDERNIQLARGFFPAMKLETLNTGHWVHSEAPTEFKKLVTDFFIQQ